MSFKNGQEWGKQCFEDLDQRRMGRPATRTWSTDFPLLEGSSREEIGKWLKNKSIPWRRRRRLLQVVTGTFSCEHQMQKYGYRRTAACMLCQKAHEECGSSWNGELPKETIGHIQSEGCLGQKEVVTATHNACIRELQNRELDWPLQCSHCRIVDWIGYPTCSWGVGRGSEGDPCETPT